MASFDTDAIAARRIFEVPFSGIRKVFDQENALVAEGRDVIHWQIGRSDFDTPAHIKAGAAASLERGDVHYAPSMGIPPCARASPSAPKSTRASRSPGTPRPSSWTGRTRGFFAPSWPS